MTRTLTALVTILLFSAPAIAQDLSAYTLIENYDFGTSAESTVRNLTDLAVDFKPYGVAGTTVINREWQRYQPFNAANHVFTDDDLVLTALANLGGVYNGGISSGQITTKQTYYPEPGQTLALQLRARIPKKDGAWPAFWMYSPGGPGSTTSEIDIFEFFHSNTQNTYDWTGYDHGSGVGSNYYSIMTNQWVWHPGFDFSAEYHTYTLIWTEGDIQKWVDNTQVKGTYFDWYGPDPQALINLAVGGSINKNPTADTFPCEFAVDYFRVYEFTPNVPGVIQAEDFSTMDKVRTQGTSDEGGGLNVGWLDPNDWMDYEVTSAGGLYNIQFRISGWSNSSRMLVKLGDTILADVPVPNTGGFQNWVTMDPVVVPLPPGTYTLRLHIVSGDFNLNWMSFSNDE